MIDGLVRRVTRRVQVDALGGDAALAARADVLADRYLDGVRASSVTWSSRMGQRYGSCTPADGRIRVSAQLAAHPSYVVDAVVMHELAHLQVPDHSAAFAALVARYPQADRARGFLEGFAAGRLAAGIPADPDRAPSDPDGLPADPEGAPSDIEVLPTDIGGLPTDIGGLSTDADVDGQTPG